MTRLRADILLFITAIIWGTAFIAQKTGMDGIGPFGFAGVRFVLSLLVILPLVWREGRRVQVPVGRRDWWMALGLSVIFTAGVLFQQLGILHTTVTNAGFLTGLYVVLVPFIAWVLFRIRPRAVVWVGSVMALAGVWLLNGAQLSQLGFGDLMVMACAVCFAAQVVLIGLLLRRTGRPMLLSALQYGLCSVAGLAVGFGLEGLNIEAIQVNWMQLAYAGIISGGIAYTLQAVAQQHTPASDAAIILSGEGLFAAIAGAVMLGETLGWLQIWGCILIMLAILLVEVGGLLKNALLRGVLGFKNKP
ncbi:MAG: putative superfamily transporter inner rane protein [Micavibrio sp.]|nr:putative superfamily transporter inner rane protein [Micavibrio sp.]